MLFESDALKEAKQAGKANDWKKIKVQKSVFATIGGEWEVQRKPWMMIFLIGFKISATDFSKDLYDGDDNDYKLSLAEIFGIKPLKAKFEKLFPNDWDFLGPAYSYDHTPHQFTLKKTSDFQFALDAMMPDKFAKADDRKGAKLEAERVASKLLKCDCLQSTNEWTLKPLTTVK